MSNSGINISNLWRKEEWLVVLAGYLVIVLILAGLTVKLPKFKWTTGSEFSAFAAKTSSAVGKLAQLAEEKGEKALGGQAVSLKAALDAGDRKASGDAARKLADVGKDVKDEGLKKKADKLSSDIKAESGNVLSKVFTPGNIIVALAIGLAFFIITSVASYLMGEKIDTLSKGFPVLFLLAWGAQFIAGNYTIQYFGVEYVLWCLFLGLFVSNILGTPEWLKSAARTEFYIKIGLVILGAGILAGEIAKAGAYGIVQALVVVSTVWYFTFWVAKKLKVDDEFAAILSSGVSICGVSAAIATAGAVKGDPKKLSYTTSIILICAIPMLLLQPLIAKALGMSDLVAGAWLGGTLDTSGSVVAAGSLISETAMKTGVIVKMSQNVLIGVVTFILSVIWTLKGKADVPADEKPGLIEIWRRFPKFVLGFIIASLVFSFLVPPATVEATKGALAGLRTWWFALAFTSIGLETRFSDLAKLGGGRPAIAFITGQTFNIFWTLLLAYLLFGGAFFPIPKI